MGNNKTTEAILKRYMVARKQCYNGTDDRETNEYSNK